MRSTAILILAAGESSRMGEAKQLLPLGDTTLLGRCLRICQESKIGPVWIVLGARADKIRKSLPEGGYQIAINKAWKEGMGSSIAVGLQVIEQDPQVDEVMIVLADQVKLTSRSLQDFHAAYTASHKSIAVSVSKVGPGPPSIFDRRWFGALARLNGDQGAKQVVHSNPSEVVKIAHHHAGYDIDTTEDYTQLTAGSGG